MFMKLFVRVDWLCGPAFVPLTMSKSCEQEYREMRLREGQHEARPLSGVSALPVWQGQWQVPVSLLRDVVEV